MMDDQNPVKYFARWLRYLDFELPPLEGGFLIMPVSSPHNATQIRSSLIEGGLLLYPDEYQEVYVPAMLSDYANCDMIANCLLGNEAFMDGLINILLSNDFFLSGVGTDLTQRQLIEGNSQSSDNPLTKDLKQVTDDKDVVWGGCVETVELWMDYIKTLCFFMSAISDVVDLVTQLYGADKKKRLKLDAEDIDNNPIQIGTDGEIVNPNGEWEFVPNILGQLVQTIAESTMIGFLASIAELGANLILADITDTRKEALACIVFNQITCDGETPLPPPYIFDNPVIYNSGENMLLNIDAGLVGQAVGLCLTIAGTVNNFVTLFPLDETHRNFRIGMRSPSSEWVEICENCDEPALSWEHTFDFLTDDHSEFWEAITTPPSGYTLSELTAWSSGNGWGEGRQFHVNRQIEWSYIHGYWDSTNITYIEITYKSVAGTGGAYVYNQNNLHFDYLNGSTYTSGFTVMPAQTVQGTYTKFSNIGNVTMTGLRVQVSGYQKAGDNNPNGAQYVESITLRGTGTNPFI